MAIKWGATRGNFRLGIDVSVSGSRVTWSLYGQSVRYGHNWSYTVHFSGTWGSGSVSGRFVSGHNETKTVLLHRTTGSKKYYNNGATLTSVLVPGASVVREYRPPAPPSTPNPPGKPGKPSVSRSSDSQHKVSWSGSGTWTGANVQRQEDNGSAQSVASPGGNPRSWTDKSTKANKRYRWRVRGKNAGGWSPWSDWSNWTYTTPGTPGKPTVTKRSNGDITVTGTNLPAWASSYDVRKNSETIATGVQLPWTDVSPDPSITHKYRVRGNRGSLSGAFSVYSDVVELSAPPAAPTDLDPNGVARDIEDNSYAQLRWTHNPTDSSGQTKLQIRGRVNEGSWAEHAVINWDEPYSGLQVTLDRLGLEVEGGDRFEWQVRTWGVHADPSPYSAVATLDFIDQPGVAIEQPEEDEPVDYSTLNVEWSFFQAQDAPQSEWEVELYDADEELLESKSGADGATNVVLETRLVDEAEYTVRVRAASGGLWSEWAELTFETEFIPPIPGTLDGAWNDETGAVDLVAGFADQPIPAEHRNWMPRIQGTGEPVEIRRNLSRNPAFVSRKGMLSKEETYAGGGAVAEIDSSWSVSGGSSLKLSGGYEGSTSFYMLGRAEDCEPIGSDAGEVFTIAATCRLAEVQSNPTAGADDWVPRGIAVGWSESAGKTPTSGGGEWTFASAQAPNEAGEHRVVVTFTLPDKPDGFWFVRLFNGDDSNQQDIWWDAVTIERGETEGTYFDGFYEELGVTAHWDDEPYLSESFLEVEPVEGFTGVNCRPVLAEWEGRPAVAVLPGDEPGYAWFTVPSEARDGGTFMGTAGFTEPVDGATVTPYVQSPKQEADTLAGDEGSEGVRLFYDVLTSNNRVVFPVNDQAVVWSRLGLYEPEYEGVQWDGDTSWVEIDDERLFTKWDPDGGSVTGAPGNPILLTVERNMGDKWVTIYETEELGESFITDYEALSNGINEYRATTWSELDATSEEVFYIASDSGAVWLSGGAGFETVCRLPYNPAVSRDAGRATATRQYSGRSKPVVYKGPQLSRVLDLSGDVLVGEDDENATYEQFETLAQIGEPVHLYRDPDGQRVYGAVDSVAHSRQSHVHWSYSVSLTETERE